MLRKQRFSIYNKIKKNRLIVKRLIVENEQNFPTSLEILCSGSFAAGTYQRIRLAFAFSPDGARVEVEYGLEVGTLFRCSQNATNVIWETLKKNLFFENPTCRIGIADFETKKEQNGFSKKKNNWVS